MLAIVGVVGANVAMPVAATAHARLTSTVPAANATLDEVPTAIVLTFDDRVRAGSEAIQVFAPDGTRMDVGTSRRENGQRRIVQPVKVPEHPHGEYAVGWRTTSGDGHTERGTFLFTVRQQTSSESIAGKRAADSARAPSGLLIAAGVARALTYLAMLVATGGVIFCGLIVPGRTPHLLRFMLTALVLSLACSYVIDAAITQGLKLADALSLTSLQAEAVNPYGRGALLTGALTLLGIVALPLVHSDTAGRSARLAGVAVYGIMAASLSLTGHAAASDDAAWRIPLDAMHVLAGAIWIGGLVQLWKLRPEASSNVRGIVRFSRTAAGCVALLVASGIAAMSSELGLTTTMFQGSQYGHLLLAKILLFAGTIPMAALNMTTLVPRVSSHPELAGPLLRRYVLRESVLLLAVLAMTAWLVATSPSS